MKARAMGHRTAPQRSGLRALVALLVVAPSACTVKALDPDGMVREGGTTDTRSAAGRAVTSVGTASSTGTRESATTAGGAVGCEGGEGLPPGLDCAEPATEPIDGKMTAEMVKTLAAAADDDELTDLFFVLWPGSSVECFRMALVQRGAALPAGQQDCVVSATRLKKRHALSLLARADVRQLGQWAEDMSPPP